MWKMTEVLMSLIAILGILWISSGTAYAQHPAEGHEPNSIEHVYSGHGGMPVEWSFGHIQLTESRVPVDQLSDMERYIMAGVATCRWSDEAGLEPWSVTLLSVTNHFHAKYGYIPEQMTPDLIRSIPGYEDATDDRLDLFRSPITGDWPILNCEEFSPGNAFVTVLTPAEIDHFAELIPEYGEMWTDNCWERPATGEYECINLVSPIYFIRIYGQTDVLYEAIDFIWHVND